MSGAATLRSWDFDANDEIDDSLVVIGALGGGERYEVYEAWDRALFCRVAVKVLRPHRVGDERALAGIAAEGDIGSRLAHPNLVRLLRWTASAPRPYLVLELVAARTVEDHLEEVGAVGVPEACLLGIRMLSALRYLHGQGILHLDVKPANVTMGDPPRLLDLSLARVGAAVRLERRTGTPAYMAPEQCRAETMTPATDLFGLGATLYEALTAMRPFGDGDREAERLEVRYPQLAEEPMPLRELLPGLPSALDAVVMRCLAKDPARRPSAIEAALALEGVLETFGLDNLLAWPKGLRAI